MWRHRVAAVLLVAVPAVAAAGCPPRELRIEITEEGVSFITTHCSSNICVPSEVTDPVRCCEGGRARATTASSSALAFQLALIERLDGMRYLRATSACMLGGFDCLALSGGELVRCLTLEARDLVDESLRDGLTYDGMDPARTDLIMAIYATTEGSSVVAECVTGHLFACAGFDHRSDPDVYGITCAACVDEKSLPAAGFDVESTPCFGECFMDRCEQLLETGVAEGS